MAVSTCLKCTGHSFELAMFTPIGESHKLTLVQCSGCGTPIDVIDPSSPQLLDALKIQIAAIDDKLWTFTAKSPYVKLGASEPLFFSSDNCWEFP